MRKEIDMSVINAETLIKAGVGDKTTDWFLRNIGELPMSFLKESIGDFSGHISELKSEFVEKRYDKFGNMVWRAHAKNEERFVYNEDGLLVEYFAGTDKHNRYYYNSENRITSIFTNGKQFAGYEYDSQGREIYYRNTEGVRRSRHYDERGNLMTEATKGSTQRFEYDDNNNRTRCKSSNGFIVDYRYDEYNRLVLKRSKLKTSDAFTMEIFKYDEIGNMTAHITDTGKIFHGQGTIEFKYSHVKKDDILTVTQNDIVILKIPLTQDAVKLMKGERQCNSQLS